MLQTTISPELIQSGTASTMSTTRRKRESTFDNDDTSNKSHADARRVMQLWLSSVKRSPNNNSTNSTNSTNSRASSQPSQASGSNSTVASTPSSPHTTPLHAQDEPSPTSQASSKPSEGGMKRRKLDLDNPTTDDRSYHQDGFDSEEHQAEPIYPTSNASLEGRTGPSCSLAAKGPHLSRTKSFVCQYPGCEKAYTKPSRLVEHELVHSGERPFKCQEPTCNASFRREAHLATHHKSQHGGARDFICPQPGCTSAFHTQDKLARHFKTHPELADPLLATNALLSSAPPSPTSSLNQRHSRTRSGSLSGYLSGDSSDDSYDTPGSRRAMSVCSEGGDRLAEEIRTARPYACTWEGCLKRFTKHQKLKAHICMAHEGRKPYPCPAEGCDKSYQTPSKLRKHSLQHSQTKRYACAYPGCGEYFIKWSLLQKHTKIDHKTTQCDICGKAILKRNLSAHIKIHDVSRPEVPCTVEGCQKVFSTERTLATHVKASHPSPSGPPQFKCEYEDCGQAFSFKHVLERHIHNRHTNPKMKRKKRSDALEFDVIDALAGFDDEDEVTKVPFACQVPGSSCNRRFTTEALLKRHLKSRAHATGEVTGLAVLRAMEQDENRAIQDMIALHLDASNSGRNSSCNSPNHCV
ncbi:hypothetical protein F5H01DRAFT_356269 [Linnemannia elongata]|nr:hypothetical protein F5H01DRAFT_356269 [Linnemannia elongata]